MPALSTHHFSLQRITSARRPSWKRWQLWRAAKARLSFRLLRSRLLPSVSRGRSSSIACRLRGREIGCEFSGCRRNYRLLKPLRQFGAYTASHCAKPQSLEPHCEVRPEPVQDACQIATNVEFGCKAAVGVQPRPTGAGILGCEQHVSRFVCVRHSTACRCGRHSASGTLLRDKTCTEVWRLDLQATPQKVWQARFSRQVRPCASLLNFLPVGCLNDFKREEEDLQECRSRWCLQLVQRSWEEILHAQEPPVGRRSKCCPRLGSVRSKPVHTTAHTQQANPPRSKLMPCRQRRRDLGTRVAKTGSDTCQAEAQLSLQTQILTERCIELQAKMDRSKLCHYDLFGQLEQLRAPTSVQGMMLGSVSFFSSWWRRKTRSSISSLPSHFSRASDAKRRTGRSACQRLCSTLLVAVAHLLHGGCLKPAARIWRCSWPSACSRAMVAPSQAATSKKQSSKAKSSKKQQQSLGRALQAAAAGRPGAFGSPAQPRAALRGGRGSPGRLHPSPQDARGAEQRPAERPASRRQCQDKWDQVSGIPSS